MNTPTNLEKASGQTESVEPQQVKPGRVLLAITVVRGLLAILLGLALIANPHRFQRVLVNFMGLFLLVSGIMGLRWSVHGQRQRPLALVIGAIATLVGAFVLVRPLVRSLLPELTIMLFLGGSAVLMGIIHLVEGMPNVREGRLERSWFSILLGVFEVVLGLVVLYTPLDTGPGVYWAVTIWSLAGGIWLFSQALVIRRQMRQSQGDTV